MGATVIGGGFAAFLGAVFGIYMNEEMPPADDPQAPLREGAVPGQPNSGNKTKSFDKGGGIAKQQEDLDNLDLSDRRTRETDKGTVTSGKLSDGSVVNAYPEATSTQGPTIEVRHPDGTVDNYRY